MMKRLAYDIRGMTVVEVVVAVAVMAMVAGTMSTIFITSLRLNYKASNNVQAQQNARIGLDGLTRDLRQAGKLMPTTTVGGFTFTNGCSPNPQISFVLPHVKSFNLSDNTNVWAPDIDTRAGVGYGKLPYDGWYVSYYLTATNQGTTLNASGPYLVRAAWDLVSLALSTRTIARNISNLMLSDRATSACPTTAGREIQVTVVGSQRLADGTPVTTTTMTQDVTLRNNCLPFPTGGSLCY
jgi:type II secretory pathway pseudopilin PulG